MSDEGGSSGGRGSSPVTPDQGDSDPRPGNEPNGTSTDGSEGPIIIDNDHVTDFGNPAYRDTRVIRPNAPITIDEGIIDPPQSDLEL